MKGKGHIQSFNEHQENLNSKINQWDKESLIIKSIDECLEEGDLHRLKGIYKGLPENWNDNYLINKLLEYLKS